MLAQGGRCRQLDTSAASLARPLVELVPPTGEEQTVELQVHLPSRTLTLTLTLALALTLTPPRCTSGVASLAASHPHAPRSAARPRPKPANTARPRRRASRRVPAAPKPTGLLLARSPAYNRERSPLSLPYVARLVRLAQQGCSRWAAPLSLTHAQPLLFTKYSRS